MYKYYSIFGFYQSAHNEEGKTFHNERFNNIPHFIKKRPPVDFLKDGFVMFKNRIILQKR